MNIIKTYIVKYMGRWVKLYYTTDVNDTARWFIEDPHDVGLEQLTVERARLLFKATTETPL